MFVYSVKKLTVNIRMLLIVQNGFITPQISRYIEEEYEIIRSYEINVAVVPIEKYSVVIILGGHQSVTQINNYPYLLNVVQLIKKCITIKKPLLGICLGCQLIAYVLECEIKSSDKINIGYDSAILGQDQIFRNHNDYIVPNTNINVIEYHESMPYLFNHGEYVYGIQCHPDFPPECVLKYSNHPGSNEYALKNKKLIDNKNKMIISKLLSLLQKN